MKNKEIIKAFKQANPNFKFIKKYIKNCDGIQVIKL